MSNVSLELEQVLGTLDAGSARTMLGEAALSEFIRLKRLCDPDQILQTDLSNRLFNGFRP